MAGDYQETQLQAEYIKQSQLRLKKLRAERDKLDAKMTQERAIIAALKA